MTEEKEFCEKCGKELIKREEEGFNRKTGKRNYSMVCLIDECGHTGWEHIWVYGESPWWGVISKRSCSRCGEI